MLQQIKSKIQENDGNLHKILSEMMTFYIETNENPKYLILDISECIVNKSVNENDENNKEETSPSKQLHNEWISSFHQLLENKYISDFGIAQIKSKDIKDLEETYQNIQNQWKECFDDVSFDEVKYIF